MQFAMSCVVLVFEPSQTMAMIRAAASIRSFASSLQKARLNRQLRHATGSVVDHIRSVWKENPDRERIVALRSDGFVLFFSPFLLTSA
jgi:hypothetical protein